MNQKQNETLPAAKRPSLSQMEAEIIRLKYRAHYASALRGTLYSLAVVAAVAILVAMLWMPVLQITGASMSPTLEDGEFVAAVNCSQFRSGDIIAFYYNNKILIKRVIAQAGDWVDIDATGNVYVNGNALDEPYLQEKSLGECNIDLPYQVPDGKIFVMGDDRPLSLDSRSTVVGPVSKEQILGRVILRIWPLHAIEILS